MLHRADLRSGLPWALVFAVLLAVGPARALPVPESAEATSLGIDPILYDHPVQVVRFPQRALDYGPTLFAAGVDENANNAGLGAISGGESQRWFLFSQLAPSPLGTVAATPNQTSLHLGTARRLGRVAAGLAVRGDLAETELSHQQVPANPTEIRKQARDNAAHLIAGLGIGDERRGVDLAAEATLRHARNSQGPSDTSLEIQHDDRAEWGVSAAGRAPVGARASLRWGADYQGVQDRWTLVRNPTLRVRAPSFRDSWGGGAVVSTTAPELDELLVWGSYRAERDPVWLPPSGPFRYLSDLERTASVGLAARRDLGRGIEGRLGIRETYSYTISGSRNVSSDTGAMVSSDETHTERADDSFSWGLLYRWRELKVAGAMDTNLALDSLFYRLDVTVTL
jgi:hypothetical protein